MVRILVSAFALALTSACTQASTAPLEGAALVARGDYLVNGVVLCGDCHTPRLADMSSDDSRRLQGGHSGAPPPLADIAPALAGGPANYTEGQFVAFLQTGVRPDGTHPRPPMPPYRLNEEDARAVAAYIGTLPPAEAP